MAEDQARVSGDRIGKARNVAPTILIGVGGTGKEVLLRLRRRFYERYGIFGFPTVGYLWIDTDTRNRNIDDQALDHVMEQVMLRDEERVNAEVPGDAFAGYFGDHRAHPHLFSWLDPRLASLGQVINGAGQVRPLGRLAFFHSYGDIRKKLDRVHSKVTQLSAIEDMNKDYGIAVDANSLDVFILCSLAGGTGSGMFLDVAFMCRQALSSPKITGYLLLPTVFSDSIKGSEKIYANAYASLKELEFFSLSKDLLVKAHKGDTGSLEDRQNFVADREHQEGNTSPLTQPLSGKAPNAGSLGESRHNFIADWNNQEGHTGRKSVPIQPPAFNTCYLIDNMTQGGGAIGPKDKSFLCDMLAENIFLNFSSEEFARTKDSVRSNLEQYLGNPLIYKYPEGGYTEIFSQRFSTLGFSKLYVPIDRIRRACGYQLSLDIIGRWLKRNELSDIEIDRRLQSAEMAKLGLRAGSTADDFVSELSKVGVRSFDDEVREWVGQQRANLLQQVNTEKKPDLYNAIQRLLKDFSKKNFDKVDHRRENWGTYIKTLELNRERFIRLALGEFDAAGNRVTDGRILSELKQWLGDQQIRLDLSVEYLKVLSKILDRHTNEFYAKAKDAAERRARTSYDDLKIKLEMVRDEETGWIVQRKSLRALVEHICDRMREHLAARMKSYVYAAAIEIINGHIKPHIGKEEIRKDAQGNEISERAGLILFLWQLKEELTTMQSELEHRLRAFEEVQEHLIYENLYEKDLFRKHYRIPEHGVDYPVEAKIEEQESLLLQHLKIANLYDMHTVIEDYGPERIREKVEDFCYSRFHKLEVKADALEAFMKKYPKREDRKKRLERLVNNGSVRLQKSKRASTHGQVVGNKADAALIGVSAANKEKYADIYADLDSMVKAAGYQDVNSRTTDRADSVFLYTEYAGIPLAYIRNIERYRDEAYIQLINSEKILHNDYREDKFTDVLIKNVEEVTITLRAHKALLIGAIIRAVNVDKGGTDTATFSFTTSRAGMPDTRRLGKESVAIETLKRNESLLQAIESEIYKRRSSLSQGAKRKLYTVLVYHTIGENHMGISIGPFAPFHRETVQGVINYVSPEYQALIEMQTQLSNEFLSGTEESVIQQFVKDLYQNLDDFSQEITVNDRRMRIMKDGYDK